MHSRRSRPDLGNLGGTVPPQFARESLETTEIETGTHPYERVCPSTARPSGYTRSEMCFGAPIGAQVFTFERRNHSKTGVYGYVCARVPVDTLYAADKIKKVKKGFKFERFDVFFSSHSIELVANDPSWDGPVSRGRMSREAIEMGALPSGLAALVRSSRSMLERLQVVPSASLQVMRASPPIPASFANDTRTPRNRTRFRVRAGLLMGRNLPALPERYAVDEKERSPTLYSGIGIPDGSRPIRTSSNFNATPKPSAAQPLQYEPGRGWDDCSLAKKIAERGNEETAQ